MKEISDRTGWSYHQVTYWMQKHNILRRSWSEANYIKYNPNGDPFRIRKLKTKRDVELFNLGVGLFLGEGAKKDKHNVKFVNSNPEILKLFLVFLKKICGVKKFKIKAELNLFDDVDLEKTLSFWQKTIGLSRSKFTTLMIRKSKGGTYKEK